MRPYGPAATQRGVVRECHPQRRRARARSAGLALLVILCLVSACGSTVAQPRLAGFAAHALGADRMASRAPSDTVVAQQYLARMSLDEKLGQLFLVEFVGPQYDGGNAAMVEQQHAGGILLYNREMPNLQAASTLIQQAQTHAKLPLFVVVDEEGGWVDRLSDIYGFRPSASMIAATGSLDFARAQAAQVAHDMKTVGLNFDLAPDVDVQLVDGPDQDTRTFGTTPGQVTSFSGAWLNALQGQGVIGCLKHFPGLGAATTDAHLGLPLIARSRDQIEQVELAPYRDLIKTGQVGCIMSTDLLMPALDASMPAELSYQIITGVLRHELGYDGVVVTDALYMDGIAQRFSLPDAGVMAIQAGCDFLMGPWLPWQTQAMIDALKGALASGQLSQARIDQSVLRLLKLKLRFGLLSRMVPTSGSGPTAALSPDGARPTLEADVRRGVGAL